MNEIADLTKENIAVQNWFLSHIAEECKKDPDEEEQLLKQDQAVKLKIKELMR